LQGIDDTHERLGARILASVFSVRVSEPVALHVQAKRALVASQPAYLERLSADSTRSLALQGGPMGPAELDAFFLQPHARDAMRLRVWDDDAKCVDLRPASSQVALQELESLMLRVLSG
jgi:predicted HD phosphohydrolase